MLHLVFILLPAIAIQPRQVLHVSGRFGDDHARQVRRLAAVAIEDHVVRVEPPYPPVAVRPEQPGGMKSRDPPRPIKEIIFKVDRIPIRRVVLTDVSGDCFYLIGCIDFVSVQHPY